MGSNGLTKSTSKFLYYVGNFKYLKKIFVLYAKLKNYWLSFSFSNFKKIVYSKIKD